MESVNHGRGGNSKTYARSRERITFGNVMQKDDQKCDVFKIVKGMVKTNQDIISQQCIWNDDGELAVSYEDKK